MLTNINNYIDTYINKHIPTYEDTYTDEQLNKLFIELTNKFATDENNNISNITFILMDKFNYNPLDSELDDIKKLCVDRIGQKNFRQQLISKYHNCQITNDSEDLCEACHIEPFCNSKSYNVNNGLLLNRCFHKMFDSFKFSIDSNNYVKFNKLVMDDDEYKHYHCYDGKLIGVDDNSKQYISIHYDKFLNINGL